MRCSYLTRWGRLASALAIVLAAGAWPAAAAVDGRLTIKVADQQSGRPLAARLQLRDGRERPVLVRAQGAATAGGATYFDGSATLELRRGTYAFLIDAGPEFTTQQGRFTIGRRAEDASEVALTRRVDMQAEGWWAGDVDVRLPLEDAAMAMRAQGVAFAPMTAAVNRNGRRAAVNGGAAESLLGPLAFGPWTSCIERRGGKLLLVGPPLVDVSRSRDVDAATPIADAGRKAGALIVAQSSTAWELPLWIAAGGVDAVAIMPSAGAKPGADGERPPPEPRLFVGSHGAGRYSEWIYHQLLECGLHVAPAAGSGAGKEIRALAPGTPLGAARVYVHCGDAFTTDAWQTGLRAGAAMATNGPLLRTTVEGKPPGCVFRLASGERRSFQIALKLAFYEQAQVEYLEIVKNGKPVHTVRLDELAREEGRLPPVEFDASGWFLVRAVTNKSEFYQYATTGPYYVEVDGQPRVSRASAAYFLRWLDDAAARFANLPVADIDAARTFWKTLAERANAD